MPGSLACLLDGSRYVPVAVLFRDPGLFVLDQVVGTFASAVLVLGPSAITVRHGTVLRSATAAVQARTATGTLASDPLGRADHTTTGFRESSTTARTSTTSASRASSGATHAADASSTSGAAVCCRATTSQTTTNTCGSDAAACSSAPSETGHSARGHNAWPLGSASIKAPTTTDTDGANAGAGPRQAWRDAVYLRLGCRELSTSRDTGIAGHRRSRLDAGGGTGAPRLVTRTSCTRPSRGSTWHCDRGRNRHVITRRSDALLLVKAAAGIEVLRIDFVVGRLVQNSQEIRPVDANSHTPESRVSHALLLRQPRIANAVHPPTGIRAGSALTLTSGPLITLVTTISASRPTHRALALRATRFCKVIHTPLTSFL